jgi:hypothetical protein
MPRLKRGQPSIDSIIEDGDILPPYSLTKQ